MDYNNVDRRIIILEASEATPVYSTGFTSKAPPGYLNNKIIL